MTLMTQRQKKTLVHFLSSTEDESQVGYNTEKHI